MPNSLIILGAGASHGCLNDKQRDNRKRSLDFPLTGQLFDPEYYAYLKDRIGKESLKRFIDPLFSKEIRDVLLGGDEFLKQISSCLTGREDLEQEVSSLWKSAKENNTQRQRQLIAFSYYLQFLLYFLSEDSAKENIPGNSYYALAGEINDSLFKDKNSEIFIVNFNYDILMQNALKSIEGGVANRVHYKPIHGSCDKCWVSSPDQKDGVPRLPFKDLRHHGKRIENFDFNEFFTAGPEEYNFLETCKTIRDGNLYIPRPVLTLPFFEKQICNSHRYKEIESWFSRVDKILIIGWSAKDKDLIGLIEKNNVNKLLHLTVVAGKDVNDIFNRFPEKNFPRAAQCVGFNEFMRSQGCKTFFGTA